MFLTRYEQLHPGLIQYVQFGDEWLSEYGYVGTGEQFAATQRAFYDAVKGVNPSLIVVLGGFSVGQPAALAAHNGTISSFWDGNGDTITADQVAEEVAVQESALAAGQIEETIFGRLAAVLDGGSYDWVDAHLYDQYEQWDEYVAALRSELPAGFVGKVVCTEFGGPRPVIEARISNEGHGMLVQEYIRALDQLDLEFALHFHLVRSPVSLHDRSGLMRLGIFGPRELPAYGVFGRINNPEAGWE